MLSNVDDSARLDAIFEALGNAKRRDMVRLLSYHPATVSQLAEEVDVSLPSIHRHVRTLERAGLIQRRKIGRINFIAIKREGMVAAKTWIMQYHLEFGNDDETLQNYIDYLTNNTANKE